MFVENNLKWIQLLLLLTFSTSTLAFNEANLRLRHVNLIWRHGARSPTRTYPNDPYNDKPVWPQGLGQLTQVGMRQHYEFGKYLRSRYNHLLSSNYNRTQIYIRSTDYDRTLMSAESNLAGLYSPEGRQKWNGSNTNWQPIPVHTVRLEEDQLLNYVKNCPRYDLIQQEIHKSLYYKKIDRKYKPFLSEIKNLTGFKTELNISDSWMIHDPLTCERAQNLTLPDWVTPYRFNTLHALAGIDFGFMFGANTKYKTSIAQLGAGYLLKQIIQNMDDNIGRSQSYKVNVYSAHDTTLSGLLVALDVYEMKPPPFASSIIFELYENSDEVSTNKFIVKAFYRNSTTEPPISLSLLGCDFNCPLSELKERLKPLLPVTAKPDCRIHEDINSNDSTDTFQQYSKAKLVFNILIAGIVVLICLLLLMTVILCRVTKKSSKDYSYRSLISHDDI